MFKKQERLSQVEFAEYFKRGKRHHTTHLTIITAPLATRKVAVVAGKKVAKSAVRRNLLRRRVYARLRMLLGETAYQGVLIVILKPTYNSLPRKTADAILYQSIAEVLEST